jgi:putative tryptophan/tyrosine transport system substrate-binding protein
MKRREFMVLVGAAAIAWSLGSYAQAPQSAPPSPKRIGILTLFECPVAPDGPAKPMLRRLAELGWIEGQTFLFDCVSVGRFDQLPTLASGLVSRRPDVLIAGQWALVIALKQATTTIPTVMLGTWEPVRLGLITSLARPEGNVTGVAWLGLLPKQMELLKETLPHMRRVAFILGIPGSNPSPPEVSKIADEDLKSVASTLGLTWQIFRAADANDYDQIFARIAAEHFDAAYIPGTAINIQNATRIRELALRHRIPAASEAPEWALGEGGLLLAYGQDYDWGLARGAEYVDKILRGAKPSDLPVVQATKFELAINLKTAKRLGLTVPPSLIARADEVIE